MFSLSDLPISLVLRLQVRARSRYRGLVVQVACDVGRVQIGLARGLAGDLSTGGFTGAVADRLRLVGGLRRARLMKTTPVVTF